MLRADAPSTYILAPRSEAPPSGTPPLLPIPLHTPSPPLLLPSTDRRADVHEACLPPRKRLCFAFGPRYKVGESSLTARPDRDFRRDYGFIATLDDEIMRDPERDVGYGIINTWDEMLVGMPRVPTIDETELGRQVTGLVTTVRHDTDKIYERLDDAQTKRQMVTNRVNMLVRDMFAHARTTKLIEIEARMSRLEDGLWMRVTSHLTALQSRQGPARGPAQPDAPEEAARDADRSMNGDDIHNSGTDVGRNERAARECTYPDFMKCQPLNFKGTEGVVELTQWNVGPDVAYAMTGQTLKRDADNLLPMTRIKKLKGEFEGERYRRDSYNQRFFQELLLRVLEFLEESDKNERYDQCLPDIRCEWILFLYQHKDMQILKSHKMYSTRRK
ncbi:hypothetical protein Tco_0642284 [Tanacetum coccineum]